MRRWAGEAGADAGAGAGTPLVLLTAVPRGGRMDFLVQKCSELGVSRIVPVIAERSVVRPEPGRRARWEKIAREAARQCGRADVPVVAAPDALATALAAPDLPERRLMLSTDAAGQSLRALLARARRRRRCWSVRKAGSPPARSTLREAAGLRAREPGVGASSASRRPPSSRSRWPRRPSAPYHQQRGKLAVPPRAPQNGAVTVAAVPMSAPPAPPAPSPPRAERVVRVRVTGFPRRAVAALFDLGLLLALTAAVTTTVALALGGADAGPA